MIPTADTSVSGYSCSLRWSSINQRTASSRWVGEISVSYHKSTGLTNFHRHQQLTMLTNYNKGQPTDVH